MAYPAPPWTLTGTALYTLHLVDRDRARGLLPPTIKVVSLLPGKTLVVLFVAAYGPGSTLEYHELIIGVLARRGHRFGFWVPWIFVDDADSRAGGRELWGLPKQLAEFRWHMGTHGEVEVRQGNRRLCTLHCRRSRALWPQPLLLPVLSQRGRDLLWFSGRLSARLGFARGRLHVPRDSPFARLGLDGAVTTLQLRPVRLVARPPHVIDHVAAAQDPERAC